MLDSYNIRAVTEQVTKTVHEHRAPTDQSVALLREMERQAADEVIKSVRVADTLIDGVLHRMYDHISDVDRYRCVLKINGKRLVADYEQRYGLDRDAALIGVRDAIAQEIANAIMPGLVKSLGKFW